MEFLRSCFKPHHEASFQIIRPKIYRMTTLPGLPSKLLFNIFDLLPPVDIKCLSLCNRRLYKLSPAYYRPFSPALARTEKLSILARLERDLPEYFACYICQRLHKYDRSESFGLSGVVHKRTSKLPCVKKSYDWWEEVGGGTTMSLGTHIHFNHTRNRISHHQLKLVMRRYQLGPMAGINPESLSYTEIRFYRHPLRAIPWYPPAVSP